jgi:hypothetical protein
MKTLILTFPHLLAMPDRTCEEHYRVMSVEQDVSFRPGEMLTKEKVADLCDMTGMWRVIIRESKQ